MQEVIGKRGENMLQDGHKMVTVHFRKLESLANLTPGNHTPQKLKRNAVPTVPKFSNFKGLHGNLPSELSSVIYKFKLRLPSVMTLCTLRSFVYLYTSPVCCWSRIGPCETSTCCILCLPD